jgi:hypothetical protein
MPKPETMAAELTVSGPGSHVLRHLGNQWGWSLRNIGARRNCSSSTATLSRARSGKPRPASCQDRRRQIPDRRRQDRQTAARFEFERLAARAVRGQISPQ